LLNYHNGSKASFIEEQKMAKAKEFKSFSIPKEIETRVPRHWFTLMDEMLNEIS